jgi:hypothetical protein
LLDFSANIAAARFCASIRFFSTAASRSCLILACFAISAASHGLCQNPSLDTVVLTDGRTKRSDFSLIKPLIFR